LKNARINAKNALLTLVKYGNSGYYDRVRGFLKKYVEAVKKNVPFF